MKLRLIFISFIFLLQFHLLFPQEYSLKVHINQMPDVRVFLASVKGDEIMLRDSVASQKGSFQFRVSEEYTPGIYRIILGDKDEARFFNRDQKGFDLVLNNENVELITDFSDLVTNMQILNSAENEVYFQFMKTRSRYRIKYMHLLPLFDIYDDTDSFYTGLREEFIKTQKELIDSIFIYAGQLPGSFTSSLISTFPEPVFDPAIGTSLPRFMQEHYFDMVRLNDPLLINSPVYTQKVMSYLMFFGNQNYARDKQEDEFIKAVDKIMAEVNYSAEVYDFVLNYLVEGFESFQMEEVLVHLADNYVAGECETDSKKLMEARLEAYQRMSVGKITDDIILPDQSDIPQRMSESNSAYTLLVFWSSWCPHCQNLLPRLKNWYENDIGDESAIQLYTVSIDTSKFAWEEFVMENHLPGINVLEKDGWEGKFSKKYNIYATPTMFLLDNRRRIIAKPISLKDVKKALEDLIGD